MVHRSYSQNDVCNSIEVEQTCRRHSVSTTKPSKELGGVNGVSRSVLFGHVQVMEFHMEIGDNPSVSDGCPLTIGWKMQKNTRYDVDSYETMRPTSERRQRKELRISSERRTQILLDRGYAPQKIATTALEALKIKDSREVRIRNRKFDRMYEALVMTGHKVKKVASKAHFPLLMSPDGQRKRLSAFDLPCTEGSFQPPLLISEARRRNSGAAA